MAPPGSVPLWVFCPSSSTACYNFIDQVQVLAADISTVVSSQSRTSSLIGPSADDPIDPVAKTQGYYLEHLWRRWLTLTTAGLLLGLPGTPPQCSLPMIQPLRRFHYFSEILESLSPESQGQVVVENVVSVTTPDFGGDFSGALVSFPFNLSLQSCEAETGHLFEIEPQGVPLPSGTMVLFTEGTGTHDPETLNDWAFQDTRTEQKTKMGAVPGSLR